MCKTKPGKCNICFKCKIYVEGPMIGKCIYGGPFKFYSKEDGSKWIIDDKGNLISQ